MSRSYKKHPCSGDSKNKFMKAYFNRKLRRKLKNPEFIINNKSYKKVNESWDICDYWWYCPWEEYWTRTVDSWLRWRQHYDQFPNKEETYKEWCKWYKRK